MVSSVESRTTNWPDLHVWVFTAQLVEHCSVNTEAAGSNPDETSKNVFYFSIKTEMVTSSFQSPILNTNING